MAVFLFSDYITQLYPFKYIVKFLTIFCWRRMISVKPKTIPPLDWCAKVKKVNIYTNQEQMNSVGGLQWIIEIT